MEQTSDSGLSEVLSQHARASRERMQRRLARLMLVVVSVGLLVEISGILGKPQLWHIISMVAEAVAIVAFSSVLALNARGRSVQAGRLLLVALYGLSCLTMLFAINDNFAITLGILGFAVLTLLPENVLQLVPPQRARRWAGLSSALFTLSLAARVLLRGELEMAPVTYAYAVVLATICFVVMRTLSARVQALMWRALDETTHSQRRNEEIRAQLARSNAALEAKRSELAVALEHALEASRAKGRFVANMSHELRTPLNAILGYAELLVEEAQDGVVDLSQQHRDLARIQTAARQLLSMVNDVLDLSQIEAGRMSLVIESFDVAGLLEEVRTTTMPTASANGNVVRVVVTQADVPMRSDRLRVGQILLNLANNAAKFTRAGRVELLAQVSDREVRFEVRDTGIGIPAERLEAIFVEFEQADISTTRRYDGTGLGLALCKRLVTIMGGTIAVESTPGLGSIFRVIIPQAPEELASEST